MIFTLFLAIASCLVDLQGNWTNNKGTIVEFYQMGNGDLDGHFTSTMTSEKPLRFWLYGHVAAYENNPTMYFGVTFNCFVYKTCGNAASPSAAWSGLVINDTIYATMIFTSSRNSTSQLWSVTTVGFDVFERQ